MAHEYCLEQCVGEESVTVMTCVMSLAPAQRWVGRRAVVEFLWYLTCSGLRVEVSV